MAIFQHYPHEGQDSLEFVFFQISRTDYNKRFIPLLESVKKAARKNKLVPSRKILTDGFQVLIHMDSINFQSYDAHYDKEIKNATEEVMKYFGNRKGFKLEEITGLHDTNPGNKNGGGRTSYWGLEHLVHAVITNAINRDRYKKFGSVQECGIYLLEIMKLFRDKYTREAQSKEVLNEYRMKALAGFIAKNVFQLKGELHMGEDKSEITVKQYSASMNSAATATTASRKDFFESFDEV